jgi:hypothetical protein
LSFMKDLRLPDNPGLMIPLYSIAACYAEYYPAQVYF